MRVVSGVRTDVGRVREGNEDSYLIQEPLYGVADGMGGHLAGDVASQTAVEIITQKTDELGANPGALPQILTEANKVIWEKAHSDPSLHGMGTTTTLLLLKDGKAHFAHVGDSRAYMYRDGELSQVTEDHTLVQRMVNEGRLQPDEAERHPQRSIITRALGVDADVQVDTFSIDVAESDRFLMCSDGLSGMLSNAQIEQILAEMSDPQEAADQLVEQANEAGGEDNITCVVIDITGDSGSATSESERPAGEEADLPSVRTPTPSIPRAGTASSSSAGARQPVRPRWGRILVASILVLLILSAGAFIAFRYLVVDRSYFVGVNDSGMVTVYKGLPGEVAGMSFQSEEQITDLAIDDVPEFLRENVEEGIEADSLAEAEQRVADLEARAQDEEFTKKPENKNGDGGGQKDGNG
ncbi:MAG TPA: Stp1/IreP family PP2C-type Ser/Thr phosphatase [Actinomycetota bacterium]|nr:Stp1/IreP family PP2C-type Ser/Thr phosphatase [Actinomycetota bacterium]